MKTVLLVDDDENLLESLEELIGEATGVRSLCCRNLAAVVASRPEILGPDVFLAILDINLGAQEPSGIAVHSWLRAQNFRGRIVFLTGHAKDHPLVTSVAKLADVRIFEKPMAVADLLALIERERDASSKTR